MALNSLKYPYMSTGQCLVLNRFNITAAGGGRSGVVYFFYKVSSSGLFVFFLGWLFDLIDGVLDWLFAWLLFCLHSHRAQRQRHSHDFRYGLSAWEGPSEQLGSESPWCSPWRSPWYSPWNHPKATPRSPKDQDKAAHWKSIDVSLKVLIFHWKNVGLGPKRAFRITF